MMMPQPPADALFKIFVSLWFYLVQFIDKSIQGRLSATILATHVLVVFL
jgi:hypothetical protein